MSDFCVGPRFPGDFVSFSDMNADYGSPRSHTVRIIYLFYGYGMVIINAFNGAGLMARITENFLLSNSYLSSGSVFMEGGGVFMSIGTNVTFDNV